MPPLWPGRLTAYGSPLTRRRRNASDIERIAGIKEVEGIDSLDSIDSINSIETAQRGGAGCPTPGGRGVSPSTARCGERALPWLTRCGALLADAIQLG